MVVLDEISGFEFEDVMTDVFRKLGYENVRRAGRTADEGRDVLMEAVVDGTRRGIVVECKHTETVGRPVVQKLHSAVATFEFDGPKRGMVATTGRFTGPAVEYARRLERSGDPHPIDLIDGEDLREIADEIDLDLYNGRIEIRCDETLRPHDPETSVTAPVEAAFADVENLESADVPAPRSTVTFRPVVAVTADTNAVFETSVGVIHRVAERSRVVVRAERGRPRLADADVAALVAENRHATVDVDADRFADEYDAVERRRFGRTETEYKEWAVDRLRDRHTTTVSYTGDNNVTYTKTCEPNRSDVSVRSIESVYVPRVRHVTQLGEYAYPYEYVAAGGSRVTSEDGIRRCVHCDATGPDNEYTYCANCGSISCESHSETERLEGTPVCTGCAVTERFAFKTKYFYDAENRDAFRERYEALPLYRKAAENTPLAVGAGVVLALALLVVLAFALSVVFAAV